MPKAGTAIGVIVIIVILIAIAYYLSRPPIPSATTASTSATTSMVTTAAVAAIHQSAIPTLTKFSSSSVSVNASRKATATVTAPGGVNITVSLPAGTYAMVNNNTLQSYNFTLATFTIANMTSPAGYTNQTPAYGFAFEVNGEINPAISFVNATRAPVHLTTVTHYPSTWRSWAYVGGIFNSSTGTYIGGNYLVENAWSYNATTGTMTNTQFYKPIVWIFTIGPAQATTTAVATTVNAPKTSIAPTTASGYSYP